MTTDSTKQETDRSAALYYHEFPKPGKLEIRPTKPMATGRDLSRAYSPGVAEPCREIGVSDSTTNSDPLMAPLRAAHRCDGQSR